MPFLNVRSGDSRVRIEHGHLYDPWYTRSPDLYEKLTRLAGVARFVVADAYSLFARSQAISGRRADRTATTAEPYRRGAETVLERGFDTVIFGHTHRSDDVMVKGCAVHSGIFSQTGSDRPANFRSEVLGVGRARVRA